MIASSTFELFFVASVSREHKGSERELRDFQFMHLGMKYTPKAFIR